MLSRCGDQTRTATALQLAYNDVILLVAMRAWGEIVFQGAEVREGPLCGEHMSSAEREPNGGLGRSPQRGPGAEPPGQEAKPPEAERFSALECPKEATFLALSSSFGKLRKPI